MASPEDHGAEPSFPPAQLHDHDRRTASSSYSYYRDRRRRISRRPESRVNHPRDDDSQSAPRPRPTLQDRYAHRRPTRGQRLTLTMPGAIEEEPSTEPPESSASSSASEDDTPRPAAPANYFAPPLYGRPGTPLPPSPSITSLLIPSRPTTPDLSDDEVEAETPGGKSRRAPQVPTYEYYGFVLYLFSSLTFVVYLLWSYLPSPFLHALGIYYYPNRWWSLAVPAWIVVALVYIFVALGSYNVGYLTPAVGSVETVVDDAGVVAVLGSKGFEGRRGRGRAREVVGYREVWGVGTDGVMDVPLGGVCEVLHGAGDVEEGDDGEEGRSWFWGLLEL